IEDALHFVTQKYILQKIGDTEINEDQKNRIKNLAEGCVSVYGPSVYIARGLAHSYKLPFEEFDQDNCESFESKPISNFISNSEKIDWNVTPNPGFNEIKISKHGNYTIFDLMGKIVWSGDSSERSINISDWKNGIYF